MGDSMSTFAGGRFGPIIQMYVSHQQPQLAAR